uniref:Uncharacterized protein n=1 Tax=Stegastes partitus TaxID=144197 RepID=A0A3B5B0J4_9TELE
MKEENLFHRRFSLCPSATSPPKIDPRTLTRNLSYGGDNDLYNLSPGNSSARLSLKCLFSFSSRSHLQSESRMFNGVEKDCPSPTEKLARKESLKV